MVNNGLLILADYLLCQHFIITLLALIDTKHSKGPTILISGGGGGGWDFPFDSFFSLFCVVHLFFSIFFFRK